MSAPLERARAVLGQAVGGPVGAVVEAVLDRLLPRVSDGSVAIPGLVVTHPAAALEDGPEVYRRFAGREPGTTKIAFEVRA